MSVADALEKIERRATRASSQRRSIVFFLGRTPPPVFLHLTVKAVWVLAHTAYAYARWVSGEELIATFRGPVRAGISSTTSNWACRARTRPMHTGLAERWSRPDSALLAREPHGRRRIHTVGAMLGSAPAESRMVGPDRRDRRACAFAHVRSRACVYFIVWRASNLSPPRRAADDRAPAGARAPARPKGISVRFKKDGCSGEKKNDGALGARPRRAPLNQRVSC